MDKQNYYDIIQQASSEFDKKKVKLILNEINSDIDSVPDPYYGGENGFNKVYDMLDKACEKIILILNKGSIYLIPNFITIR